MTKFFFRSILLIVSLSTSQAFAQLAAPETLYDRAEPALTRSWGDPYTQAKAKKLKKLYGVWNENYLSEHLGRSLNALMSVPRAQCNDPESYDYAMSLTTKSQYRACVSYVEDCIAASTKTPLPTIIQGARCAKLDYQYEKAHSFFEAGIAADDFSGERASALILEYANFAQYSIYSTETDSIIARHPKWTEAERDLVKGLVEWLGKTEPQKVKKTDVLQFIEDELAKSEEFYARLLKAQRMTINYNEYKIVDAYEYLLKDGWSLINPLDWWPVAYQILYRMAENADFASPLHFYQAFLPYANPKSFLPTEQNVYNYTQIDNDICHDHMLQNQDLTDIQDELTSWKNGNLPFPNVLIDIGEKTKTLGHKSDLLSIYAGLLSMNGDYENAREKYWLAHVACPYNNRSHWGLVLLMRKERFKSFPEYQDNIQRVEQIVAQLSFPPETENFFLNWRSLPEASKQRIKYGARIWAPYIAQMYAADSRVYVKLPFERLSQAPGMEDIKDSRIGPPNMPAYKFDNRLWDDVRGAGGQIVIADHDETFESVQGDYNLLGHEMSHQFHRYLIQARPEIGKDCIDRLYAAAKARGVFSDGYAGGVVQEYFAQGITYYLIPETAPFRYGINSSWAKRYDPDLYKFFQSIENANGDITKIECPI